MSVIEDNGQKLAAVLCVASCFPVVATVYAMETDPGWHGDKYINEDAAVVKGWQEIDSKSYYFNEAGEVDKKVTEDAVVATVKVDITEDVQEAVKESYVEEISVIEEVVEEAVVEQEQPEYNEEISDPVVETPIVEEAVTAPEYVEEVYTPEYVEEVYTPEYVEEASQEYVEEVSYNELDQYVEFYQPEFVGEQDDYDDEYYEAEVFDSTNPYAQLNANISYAAQQLVGVTNGQWCTEVVQQALANAGVYDAYQLWPDQYADQYGYYTGNPEAGNLIYYYNGGRGVDHIAVYIGDGMAVHGNYNGETVIASVYIPGGAPQYIQVCR